MICLTILHDFKYLARPDCRQFILESTPCLQALLEAARILTYHDAKTQRTTMVQYQSDGGFSEELLNWELQIVKVQCKFQAQGIS